MTTLTMPEPITTKTVDKSLLTQGLAIPRKTVLLVLYFDQSGSFEEHVKKQKELIPWMLSRVKEKVPEALDLLMACILVMSGGTYFGRWDTLRNLTMPEVKEPGGASPVNLLAADGAGHVEKCLNEMVYPAESRVLGIVHVMCSDFEPSGEKEFETTAARAKWAAHFEKFKIAQTVMIVPPKYDADVCKDLNITGNPVRELAKCIEGDAEFLDELLKLIMQMTATVTGKPASVEDMTKGPRGRKQK